MMLCHVMLESGAHWSGLPLHAISATDNFTLTHEDLMPWKCMGDNMEVVHMPYLEGLISRVNGCDGRHTGIIIDWADGYSRYQQEHKPLSLIALDLGQYALIPNNYCRHTDRHFTNSEKSDDVKMYRRGEDIYWE